MAKRPNDTDPKGGDPQFWKSSPITRTAEALFAGLDWISLYRRFVAPRGAMQDEEPGPPHAADTRVRMRRVDYYVLAWVGIEALLVVVAIVAAFPLRVIAAAVAGWRVVELISSVFNLTIFDGMRRPRRRHDVASVERILLLLLINFAELIALCGIVYCSSSRSLRFAGSRGDAFYFSAVTQTTLGYGDLQPRGWFKAVAASQAVFGVLFGIIILSRFIALLPRIGTTADSMERLHSSSSPPGDVPECPDQDVTT